MRVILFIMIGFSSFVFADFTKNGDIVKDTTTGLQWQDYAYSVINPWSAAINYCENLTLGGHDDWRLPNINELKSIVDRSKVKPSIVGGFVNIRSDYYWSSTTRAGYEDSAWVVNFYDSRVYSHGKGNLSHVLCVRAGE